ncbi:MAG: hypothetical protein Q9181_007972, partial [Wetmoreana brouardii]
SPHTPELPESLLPLTEANLALLESPTPAHTMTNKATVSARAHEGIPAFRRRILKQHGHFINEPGVIEAHPKVTEAVNNVLEVERHSPSMSPGSATKLKQHIMVVETMGERRIFSEVWSRIFRDSREIQKGEIWVPTEWIEDGLAANPEMPFLEEAVSTLNLESEEDKMYADYIPELKLPKPDITFGLSEGVFTKQELVQIAPAGPYAGIQNALFCGFCVVEFKGPNDGIQAAEDQASRSGATLVEAARVMQHLAGKRDPTQVGADTDNIIFSLCMIPTYAILFAHWALVMPDGSIEYHQTYQRSYDLLSADRPPALRRDLNNIMDWGLLARKNKIKAMLPFNPQRVAIHTKNMDAKAEASKKRKSEGSTKSAASTQQSSSKG